MSASATLSARDATYETVDGLTGEIITAWAVPHPDEFMGDYIEDERLGGLYETVLDNHRGQLGWLDRWRVKVIWKRKGGENSGKARLGKCTVPSGVAQFYSKADFIIVLSANHCRELTLTPFQMAALLYHELLHCAESDGDDPQPTTAGHDLEVFADEVRHYGAWRSNIEKLRLPFRQLELREADTPLGPSEAAAS